MPDFTFHPDESFNGAVARWADEIGGLERMSELTAIAGVQYGHRQYAAFSSPEQISALAAVMEVDPAELMARATPHVEVVSGHPRHTFFGTTVSTMLLEKRFRRFSPASLAEAPYDRALWSIRLLPFCPTSWEILVEACPYCGRRPGWQYTLGIASCEGQCMTDLRTAVTPVVPKEIRSELEAVVGLIHPDPLRRARTITLLPPSLREAGSAATLDLLVRLIPVVDPNLPRRISDLWKVDPLVLCHAIARTWEVVMGWPHALNALASRRIATRTTRRTDGNGGRTLHFVSPRCGAEMPPTIAPLIKAWRESVDLQGPRGPTILASTLSITDVAKMIGVRTGQVADIRRQGAIETVFVLDAGRPEPRHDPSQFENILDLRDTRQPMCGARQELGVSCHGVEQLVAMHLLDQDLHPFVTARYDGMQIVSSSMAVLEDAVVTAGRGDPAVCTVSLHQSMKGIGGRLKPWGPAFAALVAGSLGHVVRQGSEPIARRVMIQPSGCKAIMAMKFDQYDPTHREIAYADHMSKIDAGETLNLNPRATTSLLSVVQTKAGTRKKLVPVSLVLDLAIVHMPLTELAARRGVNKRRAYWDAMKAGVPFLGPGGFCREAAEKLYFG